MTTFVSRLLELAHTTAEYFVAKRNYQTLAHANRRCGDARNKGPI